MTARPFLAAFASVSILLGGCAQTTEGAATQSAQPQSRWSQFLDRAIEGYFRIAPEFAAVQGRHEYDGQLPDWSGTGLANRASFLRSTIASAEAFEGDDLSAEQRFEREYLVAVMRGRLFWDIIADQPHTNPAYYVGSLDPSVYVTRPYAPPEQRLRAYIRYLQNVPRAAQQIRANLRTPLPRTFITYGRASFGGLATYYQGDGKAAFAAVQDAALQRQLATASEAAARSMAGLADWLEAQRPRATQDFALGAERFMAKPAGAAAIRDAVLEVGLRAP